MSEHRDATFRGYGADAVLAEFDSLNEVRAAHQAITRAQRLGELGGIGEVVPAARTILVTGVDVETLRAALADIPSLSLEGDGNTKLVRIPVRYDGPDLELVAETAGLSTADTIELHTSVEYTVAFCGFAPGFGYLTGVPELLCQPRLDSPRTKVPRGSVGVAGEFSAVYPRASPGGWRLIGRTELELFDPHSVEPALLRPGDRVQFDVRE